MAVFLFPSSFGCDCGHQAHFVERTIREMREISQKRKQILGDHSHSIIFYKGEPIEMRCPELGICKIDGVVLDWVFKYD